MKIPINIPFVGREEISVATSILNNVAYLDRISEIAEKFNIPIIEDSAQSLGSTFKKKHTGTFFEMGCFSMYPAKTISEIL